MTNNWGSVSNNYYLEGIAEYGIGSQNLYKPSNAGATPISSDELKQKATDLGAKNWKDDTYNINNGYPILSWQTDNDNLNLINDENAFVEDTDGINGGFPILAWQVETKE